MMVRVALFFYCFLFITLVNVLCMHVYYYILVNKNNK